MQFMKKEMMVAMSTLDDLYNANQVNLQLLAVFPAVLVGLGFYFVLTNIWHSIVSKRVAPTAMVHQAMRSSLREVERLLTCRYDFIGMPGCCSPSDGILLQQWTCNVFHSVC